MDEIVARYGDERRTAILPHLGDMSVEDLIPEEEMVVTITRGGYAKRTRSDNYRQQKRGGKGVRGTQLREDDIVDHFFVTTTHHWLLFFTNLGRVYRAKGYELPEGGRDSKGQHVANLMAFQPGEHIAQVLDIPDYDAADYLVLATRRGVVKKTRLEEYNSPRSGGLIAINLREDEEGRADELVAARLVNADDDLILVSRKGQSIRFHASDDTIRPLGRATSGVTGMKFRGDDELLAAQVVTPGTDLFVVTEGGFAKRTRIDEYRVQGRGGLGIKVANLVEARGDLVGALVTDADDEVLVIMERGKIVRSAVAEVNLTGRNTQGVTFAKPDKGDRIIAVARNAERNLEQEDAEQEDGPEGPNGGNGVDGVTVGGEVPGTDEASSTPEQDSTGREDS
jgi:DNA gyrase subunit A